MNGIDDIRTSVLVQEDIQRIQDEIQASDLPLRLQRGLALLEALLPMVVFLEDAGRVVIPGDLLDLGRLEKLLFEAAHSLGAAFARPSQWIEARLKELPGYVFALRGTPTPTSQEIYALAMLHARSLGMASASVPAVRRAALEARGDVLVRIERAVAAYGDARARSAMDSATLKAELMCQIEAGLVAEASSGSATEQKVCAAAGARTVPDRKGVYAWVTSSGSAALVLVSTRPTEHCTGGTLNAVVMDSVKFYDGCAVDQWGKDGRWVLLHDFAGISRPAGVDHE